MEDVYYPRVDIDEKDGQVTFTSKLRKEKDGVWYDIILRHVEHSNELGEIDLVKALHSFHCYAYQSTIAGEVDLSADLHRKITKPSSTQIPEYDRIIQESEKSPNIDWESFKKYIGQ